MAKRGSAIGITPPLPQTIFCATHVPFPSPLARPEPLLLTHCQQTGAAQTAFLEVPSQSLGGSNARAASTSTRQFRRARSPRTHRIPRTSLHRSIVSWCVRVQPRATQHPDAAPLPRPRREAEWGPPSLAFPSARLTSSSSSSSPARPRPSSPTAGCAAMSPTSSCARRAAFSSPRSLRSPSTFPTPRPCGSPTTTSPTRRRSSAASRPCGTSARSAGSSPARTPTPGLP